jgi:Tol biopolymer transport system component
MRKEEEIQPVKAVICSNFMILQGAKSPKKNSIIMVIMNWRTGVLIAIALVVAGLLTGWQLSPRVADVLPPEGELQGRQPVTILFNRAMDPESVEESLLITPDYEGEINWSNGFKELTFTPRKIWPSGSSVSISLGRGSHSKLKIPSWQEVTFSWSVSPTSLVYLWPADGNSNLYKTNPLNGENQALTNHPEGILDYSISPDSEQIYYSISGQNGGSKINSLDLQSLDTSLVLDCEESLCAMPQLSFDGEWLAYEMINRENGVQPGIRVLNLDNQSEQDLGLSSEYLESPLWSVSGWLSYYNQTAKGYQFWNPETDITRFLPNETGGFGTWSADGRYFLSSEILFVGDTLAPRHLQLYDLVEETIQDLSLGDYLEDMNPSFSTRGLTFAFGRKSLNPQDWTPGRQLWVMDLETGESTPLTESIDYQHTAFSWHPDGKQLAFVRYNQATLSEAPEIWLIDTTSTVAMRLIINGFAPGWIP